MDRHARPRAENPREMKRRAVDGPRNSIQRDSFKEPAGKQRLDRLGKLGVLGLGVRAAFLAWQSVSRVCGLEHIGYELQSRFVGPERLERLRLRPFRAASPVRGASRKRPLTHGPVTNGNGRPGRSSKFGSISRTMSANTDGAGSKSVPRSPQSAGWLTR